MDLLGEIAARIGEAFGAHLRLAPYYLASFAAIAWLLWRLRGRPGRFLGWLLPRQIYLHRSHMVDIQVFLLGRLVAATGLFARITFTAGATLLTLALLVSATGGTYDPPPVSPWRMALVTVLMVAVIDFCGYWVHRLHHETAVLWPFHALHHSAEVMTPVTFYRKHPVYDLLMTLAASLFVGTAQGAMLFLLVGQIDMLTIGGANAAAVLYTAAIANFNHSHIWVSYGRRLNHVFMSPAQHQIHHSCAVEHHDRNYGNVFAVWDWMFGTLYVPERPETLRFGLADRAGRPIPQPHPDLRSAMLRPFAESWAVLRGRRAAPRPEPETPARRKAPGTRAAG
ncbi:sterol desaturase family protein [Paralimibaculum aggregatum]|uniref:Sterol desaturase family protein n=2 Tax=Paralimibaculum aggregatum TaxID=3036245 RepID=A0ABQ6LHI0_9RHOB|nr:sterol desaturase family protein [Limibaculum sp. NKW23]